MDTASQYSAIRPELMNLVDHLARMLVMDYKQQKQDHKNNAESRNIRSL